MRSFKNFCFKKDNERLIQEVAYLIEANNLDVNVIIESLFQEGGLASGFGTLVDKAGSLAGRVGGYAGGLLNRAVDGFGRGIGAGYNAAYGYPKWQQNSGGFDYFGGGQQQWGVPQQPQQQIDSVTGAATALNYAIDYIQHDPNLQNQLGSSINNLAGLRDYLLQLQQQQMTVPFPQGMAANPAGVQSMQSVQPQQQTRVVRGGYGQNKNVNRPLPVARKLNQQPQQGQSQPVQPQT